ncbi:MAG TPA: hypothetical protein VHN98_06395, partial [Acidimicrobiales bacterium]|nr:hypothetical protein [Acidimicrobiales bacterium]
DGIRGFAPLLPRIRLSRLSVRDAPVLLSLAGIGGYMAYLAARFSEPLAFMKVESAPGWNRDLTFSTLVKADFFRLWAHPAPRWDTIGLTIQFLLVVASLALLPAIARRFGWGYTAFVVISVVLPVISSREFLATGRYTLVAFPVMAAGADVLARRRGAAGRVLRWLLPAALAGGLVWMASFWARWYLLT